VVLVVFGLVIVFGSTPPWETDHHKFGQEARPAAPRTEFPQRFLSKYSVQQKLTRLQMKKHFPFGSFSSQQSILEDLQLLCANFTVPLDWEVNTGRNMNYFVTRVSRQNRKGRAATKQLWILNGGPGGSGGELINDASQWLDILGDDFDIFLPDHRGTGESSFLDCPMGDMQSCVKYLQEKWGDDLHYFTTTGAAFDLQFGINAAIDQFSYENSFIYGLSYGTYWATRYMVITENTKNQPVDAFVLDGICPPDLCRIISYDLNADALGAYFMNLCAADPYCVRRLGVNPFHSLSKLFEAVRNQSLPCLDYLPRLNPSELRSVLTFVVDRDFRILVPPIISRLLRCNAADVKALQLLFGPRLDKTSFAGSSLILGTNILVSEMLTMKNTPLPTVEEVQQITDDAFFAFGGSPDYRKFYDFWDRYTPDKYYNKYPNALEKPVLLLNGHLDGATGLHWASQAATHFRFPQQQLVVVPFSSHVTTLNSPVVNSNVTCGAQIAAIFLRSNGQQVNTSCINQVLPIDFAGTTENSKQISLSFFGTTDLWEDGES